MLLYSHFHGRGKLFSMQLYTSSWQLHFSSIWSLKLRSSLKQFELIPCRALEMTRATLKLSWRGKSPRTTYTLGPCCHADHLLSSDPRRALYHFFYFSCLRQDRIHEVQSVNRNSYCRYIAGGRTGSCFSCGVWLPVALNLTGVKVRMKIALERWAITLRQPVCEGRAGTRISILTGCALFSPMSSFESSGLICLRYERPMVFLF